MSSKKIKVTIGIVLGVVIVLVGIVALLPSIISRGSVRQSVLNKVNAGLNGDVLTIEDWSFGWFSGVSAKGIAFKDKAGNTDVKVASVVVPVGLMKLALGGRDFGKIVIDRPDVTVVLPAAPASDGVKSARAELDARHGTATSSKKPELAPEEAGADLQPLPNLKFSFDLKDANICVKGAMLDKPLQLSNLNISLDIPGINEPVQCALMTGFGDMGGSAKLKATVRAFKNGLPDLDAMSVDGHLWIEQFPLGSAVTMVKSVNAEVPDATGTMDADLSLKMTGSRAIEMQGFVTTKGLTLKGGALGIDSLDLEGAGFQIALTRAGDKLTVSKMQFNSPIAGFNVTGELTLPARAGDISEAQKPAGSLSMNGQVDLVTIAKQLPNTLSIQKGLKVEGGSLNLDGKVVTAGEEVKLDIKLGLKDLAAVLDGKQLALESPAEMTAKVGKTGDKINVESVVLSSSFCTLNGSGDPSRAQLSCELDLEKALSEAVKFVDLKGLKAGGKISLDCTALMNDQKIEVEKLVATVNDFAFEQKDPETGKMKRMAEKSVVLSGKMKADLGVRSASLSEVTMEFSPGIVKITDVEVPDMKNVLAGAKAKVTGTMDIAKLINMLGDFMAMPDGTSVAGIAKFDLTVDAKGERENVGLDATITDLHIKSASNPPVREGEIKLGMKAVIEPVPGNVLLESLNLSSSPVSMSSSAVFKDWNGSRDLKAQGKLTIDFGKLAVMLEPFVGQKIDMAGRKEKPYSLSVSLKGKDWQDIVRGMNLSAGTYMEHLKSFGIEMKEVAPSISGEKGVVQASIDVAANGGRVTATPIIDVRGQTPFLTLPDNSKLISGVKLNDEIADKLLAAIHPVFKGCAIASGDMSLDMKKLYVPLDQTLKQKTTFAGTLVMKQVSIGSSGMLKGVMGMIAGSEMKPSKPTDYIIGFQCRDGRVHSDPIAIKSGENNFTFSGSVGLDQTLDYAVDIAVTKKMLSGVNEKYYQRLTNEVIRVPITGTATNPKFDTRAFFGGIQDLIVKATKQDVQDAVKKEADKLGEKAGEVLQDLFRKKK